MWSENSAKIAYAGWRRLYILVFGVRDQNFGEVFDKKSTLVCANSLLV